MGENLTADSLPGEVEEEVDRTDRMKERERETCNTLQRTKTNC